MLTRNQKLTTLKKCGKGGCLRRLERREIEPSGRSLKLSLNLNNTDQILSTKKIMMISELA